MAFLVYINYRALVGGITMPEKYFATIMKELPIDENDSVFIAGEMIAGNLDDSTKIFISPTGKRYRSITDKLESNQAEGYYYNLIEVDKVTKLFGANQTFSEAVLSYEQRTKDIVYYMTRDKEDKLVIRVIDKEATKNLLMSNIVPDDAEEDETDYEDFDDDDLDDDLDDDSIKTHFQNITLAVIDETFSEEELISLKQTLVDQGEELEAAIDAIDLQLDSKESSLMRPLVPTPTPLGEPLPRDLINVPDIFDNVTKTLIAQDEAARRAIVEIARLELMRKKEHGILLTGNPGVGKTLLVRLIARYVNRPVKIVDSTQLTSPAFTGRNIEQYLWELYEECGRNKEEAERAIFFFDEIDKKGSAKKSDPAGQAVLNTLLKFIEGTDYVASKNAQYQKESTTVKISTDKMIKIFGGAFVDVYKSGKNNPIGFDKNSENEETEPTIKDFVQKGMMTEEFLGRTPIIIRLADLDVDKLRDILLKSDESALKLQEEVFAKHGVTLTTKDGYIVAVAEKALEQKMGSRGLNKVIFDTTWKAFDDVCFHPTQYNEVILTEETVKDTGNYQLVKKTGEVIKRNS